MTQTKSTTPAEILTALEAAIKAEGVTGLAARAGVHPSFVRNVRDQRQVISPRLALALGWEKQTVYTPTATVPG